MMQRRTGIVDRAMGSKVGDHFCWSYADRGAFIGEATHFLSEGIAAGQRVAYFYDGAGPEPLPSELARLGHDVDEAMERGSLFFAPSQDAYLPDGRFDPDRRLGEYAAMVREAREAGYEAFRIVADATGVLAHPEVRGLWASYELRADLLASRLPFTALCAYDAQRSNRAELEAVESVHALIVSESGHVPPTHAVFGTTAGGLALAGEIDFECAARVADVARRAAIDLSEPLIDVSGLRFIDVAGLRAVAELTRVLARRNPRIVITGASPTFRKAWSLLDSGDLSFVEVRA